MSGKLELADRSQPKVRLIVDEQGRWLTDMRLNAGVWKPGDRIPRGGARSRSSTYERPARR
jgi:hypothetical protein